ncbi:sterol desaturase family protein [Glaciecola sp. SC05]|uniref:sterol desaturase family protein n=1 Tax=Glaciecola sp. SC05 TaxID=1987355 RepID=UPI0035272540
MHYQYAIVAVFMFFALAEARHSKLFKKQHEVKDDGIVELLGTLLLFIFTQPVVLFTAAAAASLLVPQYEGALADTSIWLQFLLFLVFDDMMQYWWHRLSHSYIPLYKLHRAHHNAKYMSIRIVYRNNFFYYLCMPSLWLSGVLIYLGLGWVYAFYLVAKLTIIMGAHSEWKWDAALYKIPALNPLMWIIERTISTPSTHSGHHGLRKDDPATNYKGNYGNMLFIWDMMFGTAKITRQYPHSYGVEGMRKAEWAEQLFWPLIKPVKPIKKDK